MNFTASTGPTIVGGMSHNPVPSLALFCMALPLVLFLTTVYWVSFLMLGERVEHLEGIDLPAFKVAYEFPDHVTAALYQPAAVIATLIEGLPVEATTATR